MKAANEVLRIERFPSLFDLVRTRRLAVGDIPALRRSNDSKRFRAWLAQATQDDEFDEICQAYVDAVTNAKGLGDRNWFRALRLVSLGGLSVVLGPTPLSAFLSAMGLTALDHVVVDKLVAGWSPKRFIEQVGRRAGEP